jgi:hypothetical protein
MGFVSLLGSRDSNDGPRYRRYLELKAGFTPRRGRALPFLYEAWEWWGFQHHLDTLKIPTNLSHSPTRE